MGQYHQQAQDHQVDRACHRDLEDQRYLERRMVQVVQARQFPPINGPKENRIQLATSILENFHFTGLNREWLHIFTLSAASTYFQHDDILSRDIITFPL